MSVEAITFVIRSSLCNLLIRPSDGMSRVDKIGQILLMDVQLRVEIGASSSSSYPREQIVEEGLHKLTDVQQLPLLVFSFTFFQIHLKSSHSKKILKSKLKRNI
jgi:hypothetical protein